MRRCYVLLWAMLASVLVASPQVIASDCTWIWTATVTTDDGMGHIYVERIYELYCPGGGTATNPPPSTTPPPPPRGLYPPGTTVHDQNPKDLDDDGLADSSGDFINTADPRALNLDANDRLGSNWGGPNTQRPSHAGNDVQGDNGDALFSLVFGEVVWSSWGRPGQGYKDLSCGRAVVIRRPTGGNVTFCHMSDVVVVEGEIVDVGDFVGAVGDTGDASGFHVHVSWDEPAGSRCDFFLWTWNAQPTLTFNSGGC